LVIYIFKNSHFTKPGVIRFAGDFAAYGGDCVASRRDSCAFGAQR
jgi:hypothetical protein